MITGNTVRTRARQDSKRIKYSKKTSNNETEAMKLVSQKMQEISSFQGDPPEPEILLEILKKKTDFANV